MQTHYILERGYKIVSKGKSWDIQSRKRRFAGKNEKSYCFIRGIVKAKS